MSKPPCPPVSCKQARSSALTALVVALLTAALPVRFAGAAAAAPPPPKKSVAGTPQIVEPRSEPIRLIPPTAHNNKLFVREILFTPDGRYAVTQGTDRALGVWEIATARLVRRLPSTTQIDRMKMTPDGHFVIAIDRRGMWTLWDLPRATAVRVFNPFAGEPSPPSGIKQVEMHPQGRFLAVHYNNGGLGNNSLFLIDPVRGKRVFPDMHEFLNVDYFAFTDDGKSLYVEESSDGAFLVDLITGKAKRASVRPPAPVQTPRYRCDSNLYSSEPLRIVDPATGAAVCTLEPLRKTITSVTGFLPNPRYALFRASDDLVVWDLQENVAVNRTLGPGHDTTRESKVEVSASGTLVAFLSSPPGEPGGEEKCTVRRVATGQTLLAGEVALEITERKSLTTTAFSADGKYLALGSITRGSGAGQFAGQVSVWDIARKKKLADLATGTELPANLLFLPGGNRLVVGGTDTSLCVYDWASKKRLSAYGIGGSGATWISSLLLSPLGPDRVLYSSSAGEVVDFSLKENKVVRAFSTAVTYGPSGLALSPDKKLLAYGDHDGNITVYDLPGKTPPVAFTGHLDSITALRFTPDSRRLVSASDDGTTLIWDVAAHRPLSGYILVRDPRAEESALPGWLAFNPAGNFEGSENASSTVHFAKGLQTYAVEQFYDAFYKPGLIRAALSEAVPPPAPAAVASLDTALKTGAPPMVRILSPTGDTAAGSPTVEIVIEATEQGGGGIRGIRLYQNDRLVGGPAALRGIAVEAASGQATTKRFTVPLAAGTNDFRAVAYSKTGLESPPASVAVTYRPDHTRKPTLFVLAVGINKYKDATMNLAYARPDAEAIADFFSKTPGEATLFGRIQVARLIDEQATGAAILSGIAAVGRESTADDVVFVYLAGHGETEGGIWHFLPTEMRQMALPERVKALGIPWPKVDEAIRGITARKVILVVDACKSGAALAGGIRGNDDAQQTLAVMARAQGIHILTAATSQQYAAEVKELGHGILTYALLEGLNGKAAGQTSSVTVLDLMSYVENRVPALSKQYRGEEQYPVPFGRGQNFPVAAR